MSVAEILFTLFFAILIGGVIGAIARLLVPGTARFGVVATIIVGAVAAMAGGFLGNRLHWSGAVTTMAQIGLAVIGVLLFRKPSSYR
ncbi:MAG: GlsB/YeaQ/YmgE family stress response membrane protein [Candidatus Nanopelagicales bacterium]